MCAAVFLLAFDLLSVSLVFYFAKTTPHKALGEVLVLSKCNREL